MDVTAVDPVCEDLCYGILENLPSRTLVRLRGTSRVFADLVDEILRSRFLNVISSGKNELVLESCPPYATRGARRQPLVFSHFGPAAMDRARTGGDVAHMRTKAAASDRVPYHLPLDDGEVFANNHLAVHLRQRDATMSFYGGSDDEDDLVDADAPAAIRLARPLQPRGFGYLNSIEIATSLDRFFRSWFVDPASEPDWSAAWSPSAPSTPTSSPESTPWTSRESSPSPHAGTTASEAASKSRPMTRPHRIRANPSSQSALHAAQIECVQVPASEIEFNHPDMFFYSSSPAGSSPPAGSRFHASPTSTPRVYEYYIDSVELDVAKVVVAAEENMPTSLHSRGGGRGAFPNRGPYILVL